MERLLRKAITAIVSSVLLSFILSALSGLYWTKVEGGIIDFLLPVPFFLLYTLPIYMSAGIAYSYLADMFLAHYSFPAWQKYMAGIAIYAVGGCFVMTLVLLVMAAPGGWGDMEPVLLAGSTASVLFYHLMLAVEWSFNHLGRRQGEARSV
ncbi:hypothetical protein ACFFK0_21755 [Paenibacillus chartarius]|uniref:Uncharacterized protein n=1 Tax=Paenibacillus chartarius TaxID=747481 RepID=A0ABV6DQU5_9BACL